MMFMKILKNKIQIRNTKLSVFDDMIADILSNKKLTPIVTKVFIRGRKRNTFSSFHYTILFGFTKKYYAKF